MTIPIQRVANGNTGGKQTWETLDTFVFSTCAGVSMLGPKGFRTDLASIPGWTGLRSDDPRWVDAAICHDWACRAARLPNPMLTMADADCTLRSLMLRSGSGQFWANTFYAYVRVRHALRGEW